MVLFWCRTKQSQLRTLSIQLKRCYFHIHASSSVTQETTTGVLNSQSLTFLKTGFQHLGNHVRFFAAPVQVKPKYDEKYKGRPRMNEQISAPFVRLVTDEGHGVVSRHEALERARRLEVDLVEVQQDSEPPVCKLMDYNKEMYSRNAKEKENMKKKSELALRKGGLKEVRITPKIDKNDLQTKADTIKRLAERGYRIKCMAVGTEDQDLGGLISRLSSLIEDFSLVESGPRVEAKQAYVVVRHVKFGPLKKGPSKKKLLATSTQSEEKKGEESGADNEEDLFSEEIIEPDSSHNDFDEVMNFASNVDIRGGGGSGGGGGGGLENNRYPSANATREKNVSENNNNNNNRYATVRPPSGVSPTGGRGGFGAESGGSWRQGGGKEGEAGRGSRPVEVNRYKRGPPPPPPPPPPSRGDFRR